jgi:hypothetical protein
MAFASDHFYISKIVLSATLKIMELRGKHLIFSAIPNQRWLGFAKLGFPLNLPEAVGAA